MARADVVLEARFDGFADTDGSSGPSNGDILTGIVGGSATIAGDATTVATAQSFGQGGILSATGGDSTQGMFLVPAASPKSLSVLSAKVGTQRVLQGGLDFFVRSGVKVKFDDPSDKLRIIDKDSGQTNLRLVINNGTGTTFRVKVDNRGLNNTTAGALNLEAPPTFTLEAGQIYHFGVIYENDGINGNSVGYLFGIAGTGAMDTTDRTSANPAYLGTGTVNFTNVPGTSAEPGDLSSSGFGFGRLAARSDNTLQEWDRLRIYNAAPVRFSGIPDLPVSVDFTLIGGTGTVRFATSLSKLYRVEKSDDLQDSNGWTSVGGDTVGTGVEVNVTDPTAGSTLTGKRFYRVSLLP